MRSGDSFAPKLYASTAIGTYGGKSRKKDALLNVQSSYIRTS